MSNDRNNKVEVVGGCFTNKMDISSLFEKNISIVFGRNGSGKSTITNAFYGLENQQSEIKIYDESHLLEQFKNNTFVFNEKFITDNTLFFADGLKTIVMFGNQVEINKEKLKKEKEFEEINKEIDNLKISNEEDYKKEICNILKNEGWAEQDRKIKNNKASSKTNIEVAKRIYDKSKNNEELDKLKEHFSRKIKIIENSYITTDKIDDMPEIIKLDTRDISNLLTKIIENPNISQRDEKILATLNKEKVEEIINKNLDICPNCLQEISNEHIEKLKSLINKVFRDEEKQYINNLKNKIEKIKNTNLDFSNLPKYMDNEKEKFENILNKYNKKLDDIRDKCYKKINNLYVNNISSIDCKEYDDIYEKVIVAREVLQKKIVEHNEAIENIEKLKNELEDINNKIAFHQIKEIFENFQKFKELCSKKEKLLNEIECLKEKLKQPQIAQKTINKYLEFIFYDKDRLKIELDNYKYKVFVRNENVELNKISIGERNIIALCYFFAKIYEGKQEGANLNTSLIVIDDPVSSFDMENKIGVLSFLNFQFNEIANNGESKIIVFTHDLSVVFNLNKKEYNCYELKNRTLNKFKEENQYKILIGKIYKYVKDANEEDVDYTIGNMMRKALEAYSTFNYAKGFDDILRNDEIMKDLDADKKRYYSSWLSRIVLNSESHKKNDIYCLNFDNLIEKKEKIKTAKILLCFLYDIHPTHLKSMLDDKELREVGEWSKSIF